LFFPNFSVTGQPIREKTAGSAEDEAMDKFVKVAGSDYARLHVNIARKSP
jgi:hypothetical protein